MNSKTTLTNLKNQKQQQPQIKELITNLSQLQEREKRALADYQNLQRRSQEERGQIVKFANRELVESLLPALENLEKATQQLKDQGLAMIFNQFWQVLQQSGLAEIEVIGKEFDVATMEAIETDGKGEVVKEVIKKGYSFKGIVIQHAQVVLGRGKKD